MSAEKVEYTNMIECDNLVKIYKSKEIEVIALQGLDLVVPSGELMAIIGNSGSGKSTLLNMLGGLDRPSAGKLIIAGKDMAKISDMEMVRYKRESVGFVWQNNARNLIPYLTATENVELPMMISGRKAKHQRAYELLELVGLGHRRKNKLSQLSGGEQQRVAIAIALSNMPKLLLADEPTGAVDTNTGNQILDLFREANKTLGITICIVTHDRQLSKKVDRVVAIRDGRTSSEFIRKSYSEVYQNLGQYFGEDTHDEMVVVDKVGRIQVPREYLEAIGVHGGGKARMELAEGKIIMHAPDKQEAAK